MISRFIALVTKKLGVSLVIVIFIVVVLAGGIGFNFFSNKTETLTQANFLGYQKVESLYTSFVLSSFVDYEKGHKKRDYFNKTEENKVVVGACLREYEVDIGYSDIKAIFEQHSNHACQKQMDLLPEPEILSMNTVKGIPYGEYTQSKCDGWDIGELKNRKSHAKILEQLKGDFWDNITKNSQKNLMIFMQVFCTPEQEIQ